MASQKGVGRTTVRTMTEAAPVRRVPWLLIIATILVIGGIVATMAHQQQQEKVVLPAEQTQYSQAALEEAVYAKVNAKQYDEAIKLIKGQQQADDPAVKLLLVSVYVSRNDLPAALRVYKELDEAGALNGGNAGAAGDLAARANDYELARAYYNKAISRTQQADEPNAADDIALYRARLAEVKNK